MYLYLCGSIDTLYLNNYHLLKHERYAGMANVTYALSRVLCTLIGDRRRIAKSTSK